MMNQLAAVSGELDRCTGEVRVTRDIHVGHGETVQVDGRSDHPLNCKRVNVILEPLNSPEGSLIVRTYALIKGNSRRVPLVFRNLSGRKMTIKKGTRVAALSPTNLVPKLYYARTKEQEGEILSEVKNRKRRPERSEGKWSAPIERYDGDGALRNKQSASLERSTDTGALRGKSTPEEGVLEEIEWIKVEKEILIGKAAQASLTPNRERLDKQIISKIRQTKV